MLINYNNAYATYARICHNHNILVCSKIYILLILNKIKTERNALLGRNTDTVNEPVLDTLYNLLLHYKLLLSKLTDLNQLVADLIKPERAVETRFLL